MTMLGAEKTSVAASAEDEQNIQSRVLLLKSDLNKDLVSSSPPEDHHQVQCKSDHLSSQDGVPLVIPKEVCKHALVLGQQVVRISEDSISKERVPPGGERVSVPPAKVLDQDLRPLRRSRLWLKVSKQDTAGSEQEQDAVYIEDVFNSDGKKGASKEKEPQLPASFSPTARTGETIGKPIGAASKEVNPLPSTVVALEKQQSSGTSSATTASSSTSSPTIAQEVAGVTTTSTSSSAAGLRADELGPTPPPSSSPSASTSKEKDMALRPPKPAEGAPTGRITPIVSSRGSSPRIPFHVTLDEPIQCEHCGAVLICPELHVCQRMSASEIKRALEAGNQRYITGEYQPLLEGRHRKHRMKISEGQLPAIAAIGCADSRCNPQGITDCNEGEMFMTRTAGNYVGTSVAGSIQYACENLGTKFVLVVGHTKCGAISAAMSLQPTSIPSPLICERVIDAGGGPTPSHGGTTRETETRPVLVRVDSGPPGPTDSGSMPRRISVSREARPGDDPLGMLVGWIRASLDNESRFGQYAVEDDTDRQLVEIRRRYSSDPVSANVVEQLGILKHILESTRNIAIVGAIFSLESGKLEFLPEYVLDGEIATWSRTRSSSTTRR
ncbi:unnamed protein product [Amoebophrya sp. A25]|nr:unnamed protein product [Amoebophrya sp. A25]|eukprot:GSA25T00016639001.1